MWLQPLLDQLQELKLTGLRQALQEQWQRPDIDQLSFTDRLGLLIDRERTERANRCRQSRLQKARLPPAACPEDLDYRHPRGLDKTLMPHRLGGRWLAEPLNGLITGPTGVGKTWIACALAQQACRLSYSARYVRLPRRLPDLALARADGRYPKRLRDYAKTQLLILDDWGLAPLTADGRRDLLERLDDRYNHYSTVVTSQLPVATWHAYLNDSKLAEYLRV